MRCHCAWNLRLTHEPTTPPRFGEVAFELTCTACKTRAYHSLNVVKEAQAQMRSLQQLHEHISIELARLMYNDGWELWPEREQQKCTPTVRVCFDDFQAITAHLVRVPLTLITKKNLLGNTTNVLVTPEGVQYMSSPFAPPAHCEAHALRTSVLLEHFHRLATHVCDFCSAHNQFQCTWVCARQPSSLENLLLWRWRPPLEKIVSENAAQFSKS